MPEMHKLVNIPFRPAFRERILSGQKTQAARTKRYGKMGDTFEAFGKLFELTEVFEAALREVEQDYRREGFKTAKEFTQMWDFIHPYKGWNPYQIVWVHRWRDAI